jgi:hypothetical protein
MGSDQSTPPGGRDLTRFLDRSRFSAWIPPDVTRPIHLRHLARAKDTSSSSRSARSTALRNHSERHGYLPGFSNRLRFGLPQPELALEISALSARSISSMLPPERRHQADISPARRSSCQQGASSCEAPSGVRSSSRDPLMSTTFTVTHLFHSLHNPPSLTEPFADPEATSEVHFTRSVRSDPPQSGSCCERARLPPIISRTQPKLSLRDE